MIDGLIVKILTIFLFVLAFGMTAILPAFASPYALQNPTGTVNSTNAFPIGTSQSSGAITVTTDKSSYNNGDSLTISGTTQDYISGTPVTVRIIDPIGNIAKVVQVDLQPDRTYSVSLLPSDINWEGVGTYAIKVQFGSPDRSAQTTFQFVGVSSTTQTGTTPTTTPQITITTDKSSYNQGDAIVITCKVSQLEPNTLVTLRVFNSQKNLISLAQVSPASDGSFTRTFLATAPLWTYSGTYTIVAQYGPTATVNTIFNYIGSASTPSPSNPISPPLNPNSNATNPTPPIPEPTSPTTPSKIPHWVKSLFGLYGQGQVSDDDLINALRFLIQTGVIRVS